MSAGTGKRVETITRQRLEERLQEIAAVHFPQEILDRRELVHLIQVVTSDVLILTDLYARVSLAEIMQKQGPELPAEIRALVERAARDDPRLLFDIRRLPDRIKVVGDKCLLDVGLIGQSDYQGIPLAELGRLAYHRASETLAHLAQDPTLSQFFRDNRLENLPIEEEVSFLQQCSNRFALYADLLKWLRTEPSESESRSALAPASADAAPSPGAMAAATEEEPAETALVARLSPTERPAGDGRQLLSRDELLAAYERILLFSALDMPALARRLGEIVVAQDEAIQVLCDEFALYAAGTQNLNRPPSYLFVGPTGVGKNYLVETLVEVLEQVWGVEIPVLTLEGPNFTYPSDINELRGATRGFIRSEEEGILTEFHNRSAASPLSVILVDEVEKAHPQLRRFFLSIMDRGTVTDNRGQVLHFPNAILIYTSNIGYSDLAQNSAPIGYADQEAVDRRVGHDVRRELRRTLSPEFVNRLKMVHFNYLDSVAIDSIFELELARIVRRFQDVHGLEVEVTPEARSEILRRGYSHDHGARFMRARLETLVNVAVSRKIKTDERGRGKGAERVLRYLRELKTGERAFDIQEVRRRVMRQARARVGYGRVRVDFQDGGFIYRHFGK